MASDGWCGADEFSPSAPSRKRLTLAPGPRSGFTVFSPWMSPTENQGWAYLQRNLRAQRLATVMQRLEGPDPSRVELGGSRRQFSHYVAMAQQQLTLVTPQEASVWGPHSSSCWF